MSLRLRRGHEKTQTCFLPEAATHTIYEARRIAEIARGDPEWPRRSQLPTRPPNRRAQLCEWIWDRRHRPGAPCELVEPSLPGRKASSARKNPKPVPEGLDWNFLAGPPAQPRPYNHAYLPFVWRGWADFGCGALGDMGSYSFDTTFAPSETRSARRAFVNPAPAIAMTKRTM